MVAPTEKASSGVRTPGDCVRQSLAFNTSLRAFDKLFAWERGICGSESNVIRERL